MMIPFSMSGRIDIVITYSDIKAKRDALKEANKAYSQSIRNVAKKSTDSYALPLKLANESWE